MPESETEVRPLSVFVDTKFMVISFLISRIPTISVDKQKFFAAVIAKNAKNSHVVINCHFCPLRKLLVTRYRLLSLVRPEHETFCPLKSVLSLILIKKKLSSFDASTPVVFSLSAPVITTNPCLFVFLQH